MLIHTLWLLPFGWMAGALINYMADVLPRTRRFSALVCLGCGEAFPWHYILWPKGCQGCSHAHAHARTESPDPAGAEIAGKSRIRPWVVLILGTAAAVWLWWNPPWRLGFAGGFAWCAYFALVMVIDLEHHLILHPVSLVGAMMGAVSGLFLHGALPTLLGGAAGFGIMLGLYYLGGLFLKLLIRIRGESTDEVPLGFGDVNLAGVIGLLLGWPGVTAGLILAILLGGAVSGLYLVGSLLLKRYKAYTALPYGPFLAASALYLLLR
ncbi:MAG: hypothetical protein MAG431_02159 [Chloroflexi bacterium]|nr:hypothetical protein [Chloroflexota bacterium]